ncbi:G8 domain-containing protein [Aurantiacibacter gilvus]|uniref:G8 domain-containing protein n=1 Tax=Aurantiacibacter gilvus TaxID=3139141 RepID=A0ABU9IF27_9SPHN
MRLQPGLYLSCLLASASLLPVAAVAQDDHAQMEHAAAAPAAALRTVMWSDPAAWPDGEVPGEGDAVTIPRGTEVVLDVSPPALRSITVNGALRFAEDRDLSLETEWIYLRGGTLQIGSEHEPYTHQASITLTDEFPGEDINTMGDRGIVSMAGTISLHGDREHTWTQLAATAEAGANQIQVLDASGWRTGDEIVLASTDFDPRQAERRTITAISGNSLTLDAPLEYMHFGEVTYGVDQRGEVGLLTRNIRIQASEDADEDYFGGHIMAMAGSTVNISGVELSRMGQHLTLARYPMHWHLVGEAAGQYIQNSSIHDTYSRCVTVHGTNNARVENNVTFNTVGHCFFLEDGVETGNQFIRNLGIQTKCHPTLPCDPTNLGPDGSVLASQFGSTGQQSEHILLPSDNTASTFWITNPDNVYRDNVAAGSDQIGFWFALPVHPTGAFEGTEQSANTWPRRTRVREFSGNTAHSNYDGFMFDRGPNPDGTFSVGGSNYHFPTEDPADPDSTPLVSHFADFTTYKNRNGGVWGRGELHLFTNLHAADNAIGFTHAASRVGFAEYTSRVENGIFVGESDNVGNPRTPEEIAYGRSLPNDLPDFPIRGYEYYDLRHDVVDTTFVNYQPNELRDAGALSYLMYTSFGMSTENAVEGATFVNSKPVSFPPIVQRWASDLGRGNAWRGATIHDRDGSVGGVPGAYIVLDNGIASDRETCDIRPAWGAAICEGDMGRFSVGGQFGFGNGPIADPVVLSRDGRRFEYTGETTIRSGSEVRVETGRDELALSLREMDDGSSLVVEIPGFTAADGGLQVTSAEALQAADQTAWFASDDGLWVKLVVDDGSDASMPSPSGGVGASLTGPRPGGAFVAGASLVVRR